MHKVRFSQLLPLPTVTEETHEALSAIPVSTSSTDLLVNDSEKTTVMFSCKNDLVF